MNRELMKSFRLIKPSFAGVRFSPSPPKDRPFSFAQLSKPGPASDLALSKEDDPLLRKKNRSMHSQMSLSNKGD